MSSSVSGSNFGNGATIFQGNIYNHSSDIPDRCLLDLRITDPRDDKTRIEKTKGNLLRDSYCWILDHADFKMWHSDPQCRLLWIKGDPGKGKTMLLCGIINELEKFSAYRLSYFFCQETDQSLRSATAVLRGLIYSLVIQQPSLISYVREKYDRAGKQLFEDRNAWTALSKILKAILNDPNLQNAVLIIDALDECIEERQNLLSLINEISSFSYAKWIVSSRNRPDIENELESADQKIKLCLELNENSIAAAVQTYIHYKVDLLAQKHSYNNELQKATKSYLMSNANNTFLWVALVCQNLQNIRRGKVMEKLMAYPLGLDPLYMQMLDQILKLDDSEDVSLCKEILTIISTVYRPVTLHELYSLIGSPKEFSEDILSLRTIISLCGSFLTTRGDTIYFIHQSAKDYLTTKEAWSAISIFTIEDTHYSIFCQSLRSMNNTLRRDIYCLGTPGYRTDQIQPHDPDPLITVRYLCVYWIDHLCDDNNGDNINNAIEEGGPVDVFLRCHFLHWLEALSLLRSIPEGILAIMRLKNLLMVSFQNSKLRLHMK
jgi:archaellum biogenesis ATPase FlaH